MILREGVIRKISIGNDLKDSMVYEVGTKHNQRKYTITKIVFSDVDSFMYDCPVYAVYCKEDGDDLEFVWQEFVDFKNLRVEKFKPTA